VRFALVIAVAAALAASASAAAPFTPATLAGTWSGTWKNETFGSTGPATIVAKSLSKNTKLLFSVNFGGTVFGCASVPPESSTPLPKGAGVNHWSATGFAIKGASKDFGALTLTYKSASGALTGSGSNPPCAAGLSWSIAGKFAGKTFTGKVNIKLANGSPAVSDINLTHP
jgi:hypothetical protein